jgi:hypothetical protein
VAPLVGAWLSGKSCTAAGELRCLCGKWVKVQQHQGDKGWVDTWPTLTGTAAVQ